MSDTSSSIDFVQLFNQRQHSHSSSLGSRKSSLHRSTNIDIVGKPPIHVTSTGNAAGQYGSTSHQEYSKGAGIIKASRFGDIASSSTEVSNRTDNTHVGISERKQPNGNSGLGGIITMNGYNNNGGGVINYDISAEGVSTIEPVTQSTVHGGMLAAENSQAISQGSVPSPSSFNKYLRNELARAEAPVQASESFLNHQNVAWQETRRDPKPRENSPQHSDGNKINRGIRHQIFTFDAVHKNFSSPIRLSRPILRTQAENEAAISRYYRESMERQALKDIKIQQHLQKREQEELEEYEKYCTFQPEVSERVKKMTRPQSLAPEHRIAVELRDKRIKMAKYKAAKDREEMEGCTFRPITLNAAKVNPAGFVIRTDRCELLYKHAKEKSEFKENIAEIASMIYKAENCDDVISGDSSDKPKRIASKGGSGNGYRRSFSTPITMVPEEIEEVVNKLSNINDKRRRANSAPSRTRARAIAHKDDSHFINTKSREIALAIRKRDNSPSDVFERLVHYSSDAGISAREQHYHKGADGASDRNELTLAPTLSDGTISILKRHHVNLLGHLYEELKNIAGGSHTLVDLAKASVKFFEASAPQVPQDTSSDISAKVRIHRRNIANIQEVVTALQKATQEALTITEFVNLFYKPNEGIDSGNSNNPRMSCKGPSKRLITTVEESYQNNVKSKEHQKNRHEKDAEKLSKMRQFLYDRPPKFKPTLSKRSLEIMCKRDDVAAAEKLRIRRERVIQETAVRDEIKMQEYTFAPKINYINRKKIDFHERERRRQQIQESELENTEVENEREKATYVCGDDSNGEYNFDAAAERLLATVAAPNKKGKSKTIDKKSKNSPNKKTSNSDGPRNDMVPVSIDVNRTPISSSSPSRHVISTADIIEQLQEEVLRIKALEARNTEDPLNNMEENCNDIFKDNSDDENGEDREESPVPVVVSAAAASPARLLTNTMRQNKGNEHKPSSGRPIIKNAPSTRNTDVTGRKAPLISQTQRRNRSHSAPKSYAKAYEIQRGLLAHNRYNINPDNSPSNPRHRKVTQSFASHLLSDGDTVGPQHRSQSAGSAGAGGRPYKGLMRGVEKGTLRVAAAAIPVPDAVPEIEERRLLLLRRGLMLQAQRKASG